MRLRIVTVWVKVSTHGQVFMEGMRQFVVCGLMSESHQAYCGFNGPTVRFDRS